MERIYPRLSRRNIEKEVLNELEKIQPSLNNKESDKEPSTEISKQQDSGEFDQPEEKADGHHGHGEHQQVNYSRDFGRFDVTICTGDDGTQIVLVLLEGRVALNGKPIRFLPDGRVADWCGDHDPLLQRYYENAMEIRANRGNGEMDSRIRGDKKEEIKDETDKPELESERKVRESLKTLSVLAHVLQSKVNYLVQEKNSTKKSNKMVHRGYLNCLRKPPSISTSSFHFPDDDFDINHEETLRYIEHEMEKCEKRLNEGFNALLKYRDDLRRDSIALVWTVISFCREAMLRESQTFVHDRYKDLYDKYIQAVGREENLILELGVEKSKNARLEEEVDKLKEELATTLKTGATHTGDTTTSKEEMLNNVIKSLNMLKGENKMLKRKLLKSKRHLQKESFN